MRRKIWLAVLFLGGCATQSGLPAPPGSADLHLAPHSDVGSGLRCMAPDGAWGGYEPWTSAGRTCPAPNRFVAVDTCAWQQVPAHEPAAVRVAAAADQSLVGDTYNGAPICIVTPPF